MEKRSASSSRRLAGFALGLLVCLILVLPARAQLVLGQYEDEAPLGTWNIFGAAAAPAWGAGGIRIARAFDPSVSTTNPALLSTLPSFCAGLTGSYGVAELYRFSIVNTGVLWSSGNLARSSVGFDGGSVARRFGGWTAAIATFILESYGRPRAGWSTPGYDVRFHQEGGLRLWNLAAARRLGRRLSVGAGLNYLAGRLDRTVVESWPLDGITITDDKKERLRGVYVNAGLRAELSAALAVSLALRTPFRKTGDGRSLLRYQAEAGGTDIRIEAAARNRYDQPWVVGAGLEWRWSAPWRLAAEAEYFGWSRYRVLYFDEPLPRRFRDVVAASAGLEHSMNSRLGRRAVVIPLRLGVTYDPQPMDEVHSTYLGLTLGTGVRMGRLAVDLAGAVGRESGSSNRLRAGRVVLGLSYVFAER